MAGYETKFKLGRKMDKVDAATASDNQLSALFRYDELGKEQHVSISVESDAIGVEDVAAVFQLLHDRGVLVASQCKTWLNQPQASAQKFGATTTWGGADLEKAVQLLKHGLSVRAPPGAAQPGAGAASAAVARAALIKVGELERKLAELKAALQGAEPAAEPG